MKREEVVLPAPLPSNLGPRTSNLLGAITVLVLSATTLAAQTPPFDIEAGFRFLDLKGSGDMYRTQINERSGFLIRSLTLAGNEGTFADFYRVDVSDLGVGPSGSLRVDLGKSNLYRFTLAYRQTNAFSALPAFANPLLDQGIVPGQHTYDRERRMIDADLEFDKWSTITPFIGFSWNKYSGPGTSTYTLGGDEFLLNSSLANRDAEIRAGASFNFSKFSGQLTEGWQTFRDHETLNLAPGAGTGNSSGTILGTPISASGISRDDHASGHTPYTNAYVTSQITNRVRLIGDYVRLSANSDSNEDENAAGSFVSFAISRLFAGLTDQISGDAHNNTWRGGLRAEIGLTDKIDLFADARREHRSLEGAALINDLFLQSVNFGGLDPRDVQTVINAHNSLERDEDVVSLSGSARSLGPFAVRAGASISDQDVTVTPDLAEIVVPGASQGGRFTRRVTSLDASGTWSHSGYSAEAWWRHDSADDPILRTDFLTRDRYRLRGGWNGLGNRIRLGVTAEESTPKNDRTGFDYSAKIRQLTADAEGAPAQIVRLRLSISRFRTDTSILYRHPETFATDTSIDIESGNSAEGGIAFTLTPVSFDASVLRFTNSGSNPFTLERIALRAISRLIHEHYGLTAEWNRDTYNEASPSYGDFRGDRIGIYLHYSR
ncbi:MAG TPA: hypothetical protein VL284_00110 [Thermoanaerobaculia bacterium]|nr:hypothetical protein [Thermoanaerobaculia bacterium]